MIYNNSKFIQIWTFLGVYFLIVILIVIGVIVFVVKKNEYKERIDEVGNDIQPSFDNMEEVTDLASQALNIGGSND